MLAWLMRHRVGIAFFVAILVGFGIHAVLSQLQLPHDAEPGMGLRMLADALVVAGLLGATVDGGLKRALVRDVGSIFIGWALRGSDLDRRGPPARRRRARVRTPCRCSTARGSLGDR